MIKKEIQLHSQNLTVEDIKSAGFTAIDGGFDRISLPPFFITEAVNTFHNITVAALIDFPYGMSDSKVRQHATLDTIHKGAQGIDLVLNAHWLINNKTDIFIEDIKAHQKICEEHEVSLKVMIDYRRLNLLELKQAYGILFDLGTDDTMVATGHFMDNFTDQYTIINVLKKAFFGALSFTMNGTVCNRNHLDRLEESEIYGVRLHSEHAIRILFPAKITSNS